MNSKLTFAIGLFSVLYTGAFSQGLNLNWKKAGPTSGSARVSDVVVYKGDNEGKTLFAASNSYGLFKSTNRGATWSKIPMGQTSSFISDIEQLSGGKMYIATGFINDTSATNEPYSFDRIGNGIWYTTNGTDFIQVPNTSPNVLLGRNDAWACVTKIYVDPSNNNRIFAGTNKGLRITQDNGTTWVNPFPSDTTQVLDLDVNGEVVLVALRRKSFLSTDGGNTFTQITGNTTGLIPAPNTFYRNVFAIAPSNNSIIYAASVSNTGILTAIHISTDKGASWTLFSNGSVFNFDPISSGFFASGIAFEVIPGTTDNLIIAGNKYFTYSPSTNWIRRVTGRGNFNNIAWDHTDNTKVYFATTSGVYRSYNGSFNISNNALTAISAGLLASEVTSFSYGSLKGVATTTNGSILLRKPELGNSTSEVLETSLQPSAIFAGKNGGLILAEAFGNIQRSSDDGKNWAKTNTFYSDRVSTIIESGSNTGVANLKTAVAFGELYPNSSTSQTYLALGTNSSVTHTWKRKTPTSPWEISYTVKANTGVVWVATNALDFSGQAYMMKVAATDKAKPEALVGNPSILKFSGDLNYLYVATKQASTGKTFIYRVANINALKDSLNDIDSSTSQITVHRIADFGTLDVNNLAVDPGNPDNLIVTVRGIGLSSYLYRCSNATTAPSANDLSNFTPIMGSGLPSVSTFDVLIDVNNSDNALVASADGLYYSTDFTSASPNYAKDVNFPGSMPTCFEQIRSYNQSGERGRVFVGTLGSGIYTADFSIQVSNKPFAATNKFKLFPNPGNGNISIEAGTAFNSVKIYDFTGKLTFENPISSTNRYQLNLNLKPGIYLVEVKNNADLIGIEKLVITK